MFLNLQNSRGWVTPAVVAAFYLNIPSILAADCVGDVGVNPNLAWAISMSEILCATNGASNTCGDQDSSTSCSLTEPIFNGTAVTAFKSDSTSQYPNCAAAVANIIQDCFNDNSVPYTGGQEKQQGNWNLGTEQYWINIEFDPSFSESAEPIDDVMVYDQYGELMSGSGDTDVFIFGPQQYCVGLSPGGGENCVQVPAGCYVVAPESNETPGSPICG